MLGIIDNVLLSQMENNNENKRVTGDFDKISLLPEPRVVLFLPEQVQLGWQNKELPAGSGLVNTGVICYINATLQVCLISYTLRSHTWFNDYFSRRLFHRSCSGVIPYTRFCKLVDERRRTFQRLSAKI